LEFTYTITDPPIKVLRRVIPPLRLGSVAVDLSSLLVLLGAWLLLMLNRMLFAL
jgi:YggT family protein